MPDGGGPWRHEPDPEPQPPAPPRSRLAWGPVLALVAALAAGAALLFKLFPGAIRSPGDWAWLVGGGAWVALACAGLLRAGRIDWGEKARHAAIWAGIVAVLAVGIAYRDELAQVGQRVRGEFSSTYPVTSGSHELVVTQSDDGGFFVMCQVNGQPVRFLVDTGASDTVLSPADARRIGIDTAGLTYDQRAETANGEGLGARITADSLAVGPIRHANVPVLVNQQPMSSSLLGMAFLGRLDSFQVKGRKLYLSWKD